MFCRHNRLRTNCPICSREDAAATGASKPAARRPSPSTQRTTARGSGRGSRSRVVTKRLARAADDGFATALAPGLHATADAERLATALALAADRLQTPGPEPAVTDTADPEDAHWLALLLAVAGPDQPQLRDALIAAAPTWSDDNPTDDGLGATAAPTLAAYRQWVAKSGGTQAAAVAGVDVWSPTKRFARTFDRLAFPGFGRRARFDYLLALTGAGLQHLEADALHLALGGDDATTLAAKRALNSGDALLLERRAAELAAAAAVPLAALDRGLAWWDGQAELDTPSTQYLEPARAALGL